MATLINSTAQLKANIGSVELNVNWANISSFVGDVENSIIVDAIGPDALAYFVANAAVINTAAFVQAYTQLCRAESYLAVLRWVRLGQYRFTDQAVYLAKTDRGVIISDRKTRDLKDFLSEEGFKFLDAAIATMQANIGSFTAYAGDAPYQASMQGFIINGTDFNTQRSIKYSRLTFMSMLPIMLDVQAEIIPGVLGAVYYAAYQASFAAGTQSAADKKILPFIKKALALITMARAAAELPFVYSEKGILVNKYGDTREYDQRDPADAARLEFLTDDYNDKGQKQLLALKNYLIANAVTYPLYVVPDQHWCTWNERNSGLVDF